MFGTTEVLVSAKQLLEIEGIEIADDLAEVEYFHLMFDEHEINYANGASAESLLARPEALKAMSPAARDEIFAIFPELKDQEAQLASTPARTLAPGSGARRLAARHNKNASALVEAL